MLIIIAIFLTFWNTNKAQLLATSNQTTILIFPQLQIQPYIDTPPPSNQNISVISVVQNNNYIYALSSNKAIQVHQKSNPKNILSSMLQFHNFTSPGTLIIQNLLMNDVGDILIAVGIQNSSTVISYFFQAGRTLQFLYNKEIAYASYAPLTNFFANSQICSFFSSTVVIDCLVCLDYQQNYSYLINLQTKNSSISISPDRKYAIVWTKYTQVYIYQLYYNFTVYLYYGESQTNQKDTTVDIRFSTDSKMFILQVDNHQPIKIINIQTLQIVKSITNRGKVNSVYFIDANNRFVLIVKPQETVIYDMETDQIMIMNDTLAYDKAIEQQNEGRIYVTYNQMLTIYGINITQNGTLQSGDYSYNQSNITSSHQFYYELNLTQWQNHTYSTIASISIIMTDATQKFNMIAFSSPLTIFFLSFFNFFTLNSIYVLLHMPLPKIIFDQFSALYISLNQNLLAFFGIDFTISLNSVEFINQQKPLYFGITSDLIKNNYYQIGIFLVSLLIIQLFFYIKKTFYSCAIFKNMKIQRSQLYFGLIVSNIMAIVLPLKYFLNKTYPNIFTKINMGLYSVLILFIFHYIASSLISVFQMNQKCKVKKLKSIKKTLMNSLRQKQGSTNLKQNKYEKFPQWFIAWQNFIYGLLVLLEDVKYFLIIILISKIAELIVNIRCSNDDKCLYILKCCSLICEVIFHITFIIFSFPNSDNVIIYNSMACLGIFWLGGLINFIQVLIFIIKAILQSFIMLKQFIISSNKIADDQKLKEKKTVKFYIQKMQGKLIQQSKTELTRKDKRKKQILFKKKNQLFKGRNVLQKDKD